jgi:glucose-6-phosphate isomerase
MDKAISWKKLQEHYDNEIKPQHLRELLKDEKRNDQLKIEWDNILFDYSHEKLTKETIDILKTVADDSKLRHKIEAMFAGVKINSTEDRAVLHVALRANEDESYLLDGQNVVKDVHTILGRIDKFTSDIRGGVKKGYSGKNLTNVLIIGIGGSYLSIEFVYEALRMHPECLTASKGRNLKFLANVDPIDFARATENIDLESTLVVINSKTFTTAETMLNAKTVRSAILKHYQKQGVNLEAEQGKILNAHLCAVSTNLPETSKFGIADDSVFGFWDWVGGRYSVWSAIGILPLSLIFGFDLMKQFLKGGNSVDKHFFETKEFDKNIPIMLGFIGFFNGTVQEYPARALLPYCQALCKFAPHIQQVDMESNGKRVSLGGEVLKYETGVVNFGEPGTNGQHSFYQLLHHGRTVPCEFIGFCKSQVPIVIEGEPVSNHDELMSNFFSQPDALAFGKTIEQLKEEKTPEKLLNHKEFKGDRPSLQFLFKELSPYTCGQLLAIYEHRTAVEGFIWNINSFDQWGVELGKALAKNVREFFKANKEGANFENTKFNSATQTQLKFYQSNKKN